MCLSKKVNFNSELNVRFIYPTILFFKKLVITKSRQYERKTENCRHSHHQFQNSALGDGSGSSEDHTVRVSGGSAPPFCSMYECLNSDV